MRLSRSAIIALLMLAFAATKAVAACECTTAQERDEMKQIYLLYRDAVKKARDAGYQCGGDKNYIDKGDGQHPVGNCADWAQVSWAALRTHTWKCWTVVKFQARHKFTTWSRHHFVYVESCSGTGYFLDPWRSGSPDIWAKGAFPFETGFFGGWIYKPLITHKPGDAPGDPDKDP